MGNLILPNRRVLTRQPGLAARIDSSNPLTRGLILAVIPHLGPVNLAKGGSVSKIGQQSSGVGVAGIYAGTSDVSTSYYEFSPAAPLTAGTVFALGLYKGGGIGGGFFKTNSAEFDWAPYGGQFYFNTFASSRYVNGVSPPTGWSQSLYSIAARGSGVANSHAAFVNRVKVGSTNSSFLCDSIIKFGSNGYNSGESFGYLYLAWDRALTDAEIDNVSANPWQIFALRPDLNFPSIGAGGALSATASGTDAASGSASLAAQVALAAVGVSVAGGSAAPSVSIPLSAAAIVVAGGSANAKATITLSAAGLSQAAGQAGLSASVLIAGAGAAMASGNAALAAKLNALAAGAAQASGTANLSGGAAGSLSASGGDVASGSAVLSVTVGLQASGGDVASGSANGQVNMPGGVSALGGAQSSGSAVASAVILVSAAGFVQAMGAGTWSAIVPLAAFGGGISGGSGILSLVPDGSTQAVTECLPVQARDSLIRVPGRLLYMRV